MATASRQRRAWTGLIAAVVATLVIGLSTDLNSPPRYDGAGYSVLAWSLRGGHGYREIDQPDEPPHAHFPPGYPFALAGLWAITGRSVIAAHLFSISCTVMAVFLASYWFRRVASRRGAVLLSLALAVNWTWAINGGAIQSEPLYLFLTMLTLLLAKARGVRAGLLLGVLLGLCTVTRHVGVCLLAAVVIDRFLGRRWCDAGAIALAATFVILPWIVWLGMVKRNSQAGLLRSEGLVSLIESQSLFYARRLPDVLTGPFVEVATVFGHSRLVAFVATLVAMLVSILMIAGCIRLTLNPRKRLAGLVPLLTLLLLLVWPFTEAGRFLVPLVPCLLVGMVEGLAWICHLIWFRSPRSKPFLRGRAGWGVRHRHLISSVIVLMFALPYPTYALITNRAKAQRQSHAEFDAACHWITREAKRPGYVLTRHPGEVFWQTGRKAVAPSADSLGLLNQQISDQKIEYLLVDPDRFANAPPTPLARLVGADPKQFRRVRDGSVAVYEVVR